jgi:serine O-acetyltransferase
MDSTSDPTWQRLRDEITAMSESEAILTGHLHNLVLDHPTLEGALAHLLAEKLATPYVNAIVLHTIFTEVFEASEYARNAIRQDLNAIANRDPAARGIAEPFLHYKGFHALEAYRISHILWNEKRPAFALFLHSRIAEVFSPDIHPAAKIGAGILIDHGTGVVIGETAVIGNDVSLLHEVTLGGTGKDHGDRHPKVGNGVLIGAGAKILGNVKIGDGSKIGACSVVLNDVPPHTTLAGVPARIVGHPKSDQPALSMDQAIDFDAQVDSSYEASML